MKLSLIEYGKGIDLNGLSMPSNTYDNWVMLIKKANSIIKKSLNINRDVLVIVDGYLRALGVAGSMRLTQNIELEIVPKMIIDNGTSTWRESLFLLAALSKYGDIIPSEHIHSSTAYKDSIFDLAGRILAREYLKNRRKLIREYHQTSFYDYSIDGEIVFDSIFERNIDGIRQTKVAFDKANPYNATIQAAMHIVLPYVKDESIAQILERAIQDYGKQIAFPRKRLKIPPRNKEWTAIYNLSYDIVRGMGSALNDGEIMAPSFMVDTWRVWEWLVTVATRVGLDNDYTTLSQSAFVLGSLSTTINKYPVNVYPDVTVFNKTDMKKPLFLLDAKYKNITNGDVNRADLYEAYAFCNAANTNVIFLAYPEATAGNMASGTINVLANYKLNNVIVYVIKVAFGVISKQGDLLSFCNTMAAGVLDIVQNISYNTDGKTLFN